MLAYQQTSSHYNSVNSVSSFYCLMNKNATCRDIRTGNFIDFISLKTSRNHICHILILRQKKECMTMYPKDKNQQRYFKYTSVNSMFFIFILIKIDYFIK